MVFVQIIVVRNLRGRRVMFIEEVWGERAQSEAAPCWLLRGWKRSDFWFAV